MAERNVGALPNYKSTRPFLPTRLRVCELFWYTIPAIKLAPR